LVLAHNIKPFVLNGAKKCKTLLFIFLNIRNKGSQASGTFLLPGEELNQNSIFRKSCTASVSQLIFNQAAIGSLPAEISAECRCQWRLKNESCPVAKNDVLEQDSLANSCFFIAVFLLFPAGFQVHWW
jgi:hypothetical protein